MISPDDARLLCRNCGEMGTVRPAANRTDFIVGRRENMEICCQTIGCPTEEDAVKRWQELTKKK